MHQSAIEAVTEVDPPHELFSDQSYAYIAPKLLRSPVKVGGKPVTVLREVPKPSTIAHELFAATANAKIWASNLAMHLPRDILSRYFRQLDVLHDPEEWFEGDKPVNLDSWQALIRAVLIGSVSGKPSLAITPCGNLTALWVSKTSRCNIEFLSQNRARFLVSHVLQSGNERMAGEISIERLGDLLKSFAIEKDVYGS
jgi:hypothetical protein